MSDFTKNSKSRVEKLTAYTRGLIDEENGTYLLKEYDIIETQFTPKDILIVFDNLFSEEIDIEKIKTASNKLFNILYEDLSGYPKINYPENSIVNLLIKDNDGVKNHLTNTRKHIKQINQVAEPETISHLIDGFKKLSDFTVHYTVKENIIFPEIEKEWQHFQCLKLMWSFHDDIRNNIKRTIEILGADRFDLKLFNQVSSKVYFNMNTIIFREETVLFPVMFETFEEELFEKMFGQLHEFELLYANKKDIEQAHEKLADKDYVIKFSTGEMSLEQAELVLNHLPVDITFVDENDKVKYFSTPKQRIFPRTTGVIGRDVQNCHPYESVDIVNKIVASFKSGKKDIASFWFEMGEKFVLVQYFAVRDDNKQYRGVLEVSQEISELQNLKGEQRLLDWL
ncbi:MAG: PAS domain-containing protein, partial [Bacteroidota bacterium]